MPAPTDGDISVVKLRYAKEEAHRMGYKRFDTGDPAPEPMESLGHFKDSATWANNVAPTLRAMAGFADGGHGTYKGHREVAAVHDGAEEDEPAEADLWDARDVYRALVGAFDTGAVQAMENRDPDPEAAGI